MISRLSRHAVALVDSCAWDSGARSAFGSVDQWSRGRRARRRPYLQRYAGRAAYRHRRRRLTLTLDFDLRADGTDATQGALVAGALFTPNSASGSAVASFLATQTDLGRACWRPGNSKSILEPTLIETTITPSLQTTVIDNQPTGDLAGQPFTLQFSGAVAQLAARRRPGAALGDTTGCQAWRSAPAHARTVLVIYASLPNPRVTR